MIVNGKRVEPVEDETITMLLNRLGLNLEKVVVEVSGLIVPRANYEQYTLEEGVVVEIVSFVGGG